MKTLVWGFVIFIMLNTLVGCGQQQDPNQPPSKAEASSTVDNGTKIDNMSTEDVCWIAKQTTLIDNSPARELIENIANSQNWTSGDFDNCVDQTMRLAQHVKDYKDTGRYQGSDVDIVNLQETLDSIYDAESSIVMTTANMLDDAKAEALTDATLAAYLEQLTTDYTAYKDAKNVALSTLMSYTN